MAVVVKYSQWHKVMAGRSLHSVLGGGDRAVEIRDGSNRQVGVRRWLRKSIKRLQRLYSRLQQQALTITPSVIPSSPLTMVMCFCIKWAIVRTSWIDNNPGRQFWGSPDPNSSCGFIGWYDEPMCARSKVIIA
ncbi:unnamed protein product [Lactuca saligna]|uniref:GRF-type domain-containing protein n=1 Tax=Lactuca saligna TaxID=75948 RepID=A0AA35VMD3_LACSI|nr:unnamed protein product [Lactuca saligna]